MDLVAVVATAIWAMLPAYVPNNAAVLGGGGRPIDDGREFRGARLLGDGKTWRGTVVGIIAGVLVAVLLNAMNEPASGIFGFSVPMFTESAIVALPTGAMLGDIGASFLKRRTGRKRGRPFPGLDQLDFVLGALAVTAVMDLTWFLSVFTLPVIVVVIIVTPLLHVLTNAIAYVLGFKDEPW